ncbi:MAG: sugar transporter permease [Herbinix sp.]|jgi:raffinose/stachyose/melibiose transport system permease protein|nr:sugar transporter permease [Herbinix sp.]
MITGKSGTKSRIAVMFLLVLFAVVCLFPIYMAFLNSFKTKAELFANILSFPKVLIFDNYLRSYEKMNYFRSFLNTAIIAVIGVGGITILSALAGWALCRTKTRLSKLFFSLFVFSMLIPFNSIMMPLYRVAQVLHVDNSKLGLGLIYIGLGVGMAVFMYHGFVKGIPYEIEEASYIDGCTRLQVFFKIVFPMLGNITATVAIMNLLWIWNDFLLPLIMLSSSKNYTLLLSTNMLFGQYSSDWPAILSALVMAVIPVVFIYVILQKQIIKGAVDSAVKG